MQPVSDDFVGLCCDPPPAMDEVERRKRTMHSVIPDLSMSEVRRTLSVIRASWDAHSPWAPFDPYQALPDDTGMTFSHFAWLFVSGHHSKRQRKQAIDK